VPRTRYARNGDVSIAYQVFGEGEIDVLLVPGWVISMEACREHPGYQRFLDRLAAFARVIVFDKRGTGLSDRVPESNLPTLEERMDDVGAVMDAAGSAQAALVGLSEGGPMCALFAATYPERTAALVIYGGWARTLASEDHPWAPDREGALMFLDAIRETWGDNAGLLSVWAPSVSDDAAMQEWWNRSLPMAASPAAAVAWLQMTFEMDIRSVLPAIRVPTLVVHRSGDLIVDVRSGRYLAEHIPGAKYVELPGEDHLWWISDQDAILDEVEEFLTGVRQTHERDRVLATVMFTDICGSTERAAELGDRRWRELLVRHETVIRRQLERFRGHEVKTIGDGFLATFDGPARGIRCARAISDEIAKIGIEVRAGLHTGECEVMNGDVGGIAVHIGSRVAASAGPGEVLVSNTVRDLVAGSGLEFEDRGLQPLKGVPGEWRLYAVTS
jgi:class 3 adenylate cyclase